MTIAQLKTIVRKCAGNIECILARIHFRVGVGKTKSAACQTKEQRQEKPIHFPSGLC